MNAALGFLDAGNISNIHPLLDIALAVLFAFGLARSAKTAKREAEEAEIAASSLPSVVFPSNT